MIAFNIPGAGPHVITPTNFLPVIIKPIIIDGYTQPGASPNTNPIGLGTNAILKIEIRAPQFHSALIVGAGNSEIRGLALHGQPSAGGVSGGVQLNAGPTRIEGCFLGTDVTGIAALGHVGVFVFSDGNLIGGITPEARNLISGSSQGLWIQSSENTIQGNLIGTDAGGSAAAGTFIGIHLDSGDQAVEANVIGGTDAGAGNVISGNSQAGIALTADRAFAFPNATVAGNRIQGNLIGTDASGNFALGNAAGVIVGNAACRFRKF